MGKDRGARAETGSPPDGVVLDHIGFIVRDLDAVSAFMTQLGFAQTARAEHTRTDTDGRLVSTGSAQHSIMLRNGYIELMQITDPGAGHQLARAPTVRHGLHVLAFGTQDADTCHAQRLEAGVAVGPVMLWARPVQEAGVQGLAKFAYFGAAWDVHDPSYMCWVEHRTPELLRPRQLLQHPNTALGLAELHYRGPRQQAEAWSGRFTAAGARLAQQDNSGISLALPNARVRIFFDEARSSVAPNALVMEFSDCARMRQCCLQRGIALRELDQGGLDLDLDAQLGLHLICRPAAADKPR